jgi:hypothetical protein
LKIAVEFDAVRRVEVDALHPAAQPLALGKAGHNLERIPQDHAVAPVLVVLIELRLVHALGDTVEIRKEVGGDLSGLMLALPGFAQQVVDEHLRVDFFLDVERRCVNDEVAPVLLILPAPDKLWIEVGVARVADLLRILLLLLKHRLKLRRRDVLPFGLVVLEGLDGLGAGFPGHGYFPPVAGCVVAVSIIVLNAPSTLALKSASIW